MGISLQRENSLNQVSLIKGGRLSKLKQRGKTRDKFWLKKKKRIFPHCTLVFTLVTNTASGKNKLKAAIFLSHMVWILHKKKKICTLFSLISIYDQHACCLLRHYIFIRKKKNTVYMLHKKMHAAFFPSATCCIFILFGIEIEIEK